MRVVEYWEFVHLPAYRRSAEGLIDEERQRAIEQSLLDNPRLGPLVAGTGGVRKLRVQLDGIGKRGGARLIYYAREARGRIYLVFVYAKTRKDNLTGAEKNAMRQLIEAIEGEP